MSSYFGLIFVLYPTPSGGSNNLNFQKTEKNAKRYDFTLVYQELWSYDTQL